jgi:hypothetical protein
MGAEHEIRFSGGMGMSFTHKQAAATVAAATTALIGVAAPVASASVKGLASPDINRVNCGYAGDPLQVLQSSSNVDCFENAGAIPVTIYHVDEVFTGNNGTDFTLKWGNTYYNCNEPWKNVYYYTSYCDVPPNDGTMTHLSIYPGK